MLLPPEIVLSRAQVGQFPSRHVLDVITESFGVTLDGVQSCCDALDEFQIGLIVLRALRKREWRKSLF